MLSRESSSPPPKEFAALQRLLEEHRHRLVAVVRRRMDPSWPADFEPDDVVQEAYLRALQRWEQVRSRPDFLPFPWLYQLVNDCLRDHWRHQGQACRDVHLRQAWPDSSSVQVCLSLVGEGTSPSEAAHRADIQRLMQEAMGHLSESDREVLALRHFDNLTHVEAAAVLGIEVSAANVRYFRALERLRTLWHQLYRTMGSPP